MRRKKMLVVALATAVAAIVLGTAFAVANQEAGLDQPAEVVSKLGGGVTPSGDAYEINEVVYHQFDSSEIQKRLFCFRVTAHEMSGGGCTERPAAPGEVGKAGEVMLANDVFVVAVAGKDATGLRVVREDGRGTGTSAPAIGMGPTNLVHAVLHAPEATLPKTEFGLPVIPDVDVAAVDVRGAVLNQETLSMPKHGTGEVPGHGPSGGSHVLKGPAGP